MTSTPNTPRPEFNSPGARFDSETPQWQPASSVNAPTAPPAPVGYAPYGQARAFASRPRRMRTRVAGLVALAVVAAGAGGAAGVAADRLIAGNDVVAQATTSATQVVQASATNPNWTATAGAVADAVVAIKVAGNGTSGEGSGVILDAKGNIVTNNHVVSGAGNNARITVALGDRMYEASVVGTDPSTDLAVIRITNPPAKLTTMAFGNSEAIKVGDPVMAIGNPLGLSDTVTTGIVSALDRPVTTREVSTVGDSSSGVVVTAAIQTNAAINPGNSGGALVNPAGELIGITSSIASLSSGSTAQSGNIGIGFAIPSSQVKYVVQQLIAKGVAQHAQLGINVTDVSDSSQLGAQVAQVAQGSPAAAAGLRSGDFITALDGRPITSSAALVALIRGSQVGQQVTLTVMRDGAEEKFAATLDRTGS